MRIVIRLFVVWVFFSIIYWFVLRPWHIHWGAESSEVDAALPGDNIAPAPSTEVTRAITINAPASAIWPWLLQIGQEKAGLYSYEWLENLIGCDIHNFYHVEPAWQDTKVGDTVRMGPKGYPLFKVAEVIPNHALILQAADPETEALAPASWAFILDEQPDGTTRLITRSRNQYEPTVLNFVIWRVFTEPVQFIMEQKMLRTIKTLVESNPAAEPVAA